MAAPSLNSTEAGADLEAAREFLERFNTLRAEIHKVVIGQEHIILQLLTAMFAQGHVLVIGVPGLAKTLLVKTLAQSLGWDFKRIQFTPDLMPSDITGTEILQVDPQTGGRVMHFVKGPIFANLILADEINRTSPKTQAALLEAMQEYTVTAAGTTYTLQKPFFVVATQNPIEHEGTYPLPEAQLDRFMFSINIGYPSAEEECNIVEGTTTGAVQEVLPVFGPEDILRYQALVRSVPVSRHVTEYAVRLARASRPKTEETPDYIKNYVEWGAGPRASQYLILAAKCLALLKGKAAPSALEVQEVAMPVLQHRIIPNYNAAGEDISSRHIVKWILEHVEQPSYKH